MAKLSSTLALNMGALERGCGTANGAVALLGAKVVAGFAVSLGALADAETGMTVCADWGLAPAQQLPRPMCSAA